MGTNDEGALVNIFTSEDFSLSCRQNVDKTFFCS